MNIKNLTWKFLQLWKCKKILKIEVTRNGLRIKSADESESVLKAELLTKAVDREAMRYLSYVLYPLCICGAAYSLLYQPHKRYILRFTRRYIVWTNVYICLLFLPSWYSWTLNSMVNGVYAFGFLFMLPQLFINYKLKSVAALPWRAFMYKAFNTFIDDVFAFIITMPTAHRLACFRDDIVFVIYLYQRWLYPVDKSRLDDGNAVRMADDDADATMPETDTLLQSTKSNETDKKTN